MPDWDLISSYAGLLTLATCSVYAGSFGSLKVSAHIFPLIVPTISSFRWFQNTKPTNLHQSPRKNPSSAGDTDSDEDEVEDEVDRIAKEDAYLFPIVSASCLINMFIRS